MRKLQLTNHPLSDLEVPLSKEEWLAIVEAVQHFAHKHSHPKCNKDDKEFFDVLIAKVTLLRYLDTDNTLQIHPKQEELS